MKTLLSICVVALSGCASTGFMSKTGVSAVVAVQEAGQVNGSGLGAKKGRACSNNILGIASVGDSSVVAAARDGGISNVTVVDYDYLNILFIYGRACTLVRGD